MRILLSNDDGYFAPGLERLAAALAPHADITVVAPPPPPHRGGPPPPRPPPRGGGPGRPGGGVGKRPPPAPRLHLGGRAGALRRGRF